MDMNRRKFTQLMAGAALAPSIAQGATPPTSIGAPFRFSIMLWTISGKMPIEQSIEMAAEAGYNGIELVDEFEKWSPEETRRVQAQMRSLGLVFDAITIGKIRLADPGGSSRLIQRLTERIGVAERLGCSHTICTSGSRIQGLSRNAQHAACIDNLKRMGDVAADSGVELLVEPIDLLEDKSAYLNSVAEGFEIIRAVRNPHVKILYDFYHEQRAAGNLIEKLENNIAMVGLVHVADVPGRHEPGTGEIDYRNVYRKLAELHYNGFVAMEYFPTVPALESFRSSRLAAEQSTRSRPSPYGLPS
jgi:hydroxypyruvate isomerase